MRLRSGSETVIPFSEGNGKDSAFYENVTCTRESTGGPTVVDSFRAPSL